MSLPTCFFKFVTSKRLDVLKNGSIRFTPVREFNDVFELKPTITPISRKFLDMYSKMTDEEREAINFDEEDFLYSSERESLLGKYREIFEQKVDRYGVLSLSSNHNINNFITISMPNKEDPRTNLLMWAHYAGSHQGFIIEFAPDFIDGASISKVEYSEKRHVLTFEDIDNENFRDVFFRKSEEWAYEQEYRCVQLLQNSNDMSPEGLPLFRFLKNKVRSITFGARMNEGEKKEIISLIKNDPEYDSVLFIHAYLNDNGYMLNFYYDDGRYTNNPQLSGTDIPTQKRTF